MPYRAASHRVGAARRRDLMCSRSPAPLRLRVDAAQHGNSSSVRLPEASAATEVCGDPARGAAVAQSGLQYQVSDKHPMFSPCAMFERFLQATQAEFRPTPTTRYRASASPLLQG